MLFAGNVRSEIGQILIQLRYLLDCTIYNAVMFIINSNTIQTIIFSISEISENLLGDI